MLKAQAQDQRVVLQTLAWETYERIIDAHRNCSVPRFTYDRGELEIVSPSMRHEESRSLLGLMVACWAGEMSVNARPTGSATLKRADLEIGFDPDLSFYLQSIEKIRGKKEMSLDVDPPPDLIIEIDVTNSSINKLPMYVQVGVPEVWRYKRGRLIILRLKDQGYVEQDASEGLPGLTATIVEELLQNFESLGLPDWLKMLRERAHEAVR